MARRQGTTTERGLGGVHQADKKRLLAALRDGEPCWRCGQPMYRTQKLDRDHVIDRVLGGTQGPAVLSHASCNRAAGGRLYHQLHLLNPFSPAPATCKTCGKTYTRRAQSCEICGVHYHPSYGAPGEQRTCSRTCGVALRRRNGTLTATGGEARRKHWPSSPVYVRDCPHCGRAFTTPTAHAKYCSLNCKNASRYPAVRYCECGQAFGRYARTCDACGQASIQQGWLTSRTW